jgi:Flp pilus assembly protein CpaB
VDAPYGSGRRQRLIVVAGLVLALLAAGLTYLLLSNRAGGGPAPTPATRQVVVAAVDIPARTQITAEMVRLAALPESSAIARADTDPDAAVGQIAAVDIYAEQPIQPNLYGAGSASGLQILAPGETIAPDSPIWRAVSVQVPKDRAVAGLIKTGDHIDLFVWLGVVPFETTGSQAPCAIPASGYCPAHATKVTWTNVEVLSADPDNDLYVLRVDERAAEEIAHIQMDTFAGVVDASDLPKIPNPFSIALRPQGDDRAIDAGQYGQTTTKIIETYDFPLPQVIFLPPPGATPQPEVSPTPAS